MSKDNPGRGAPDAKDSPPVAPESAVPRDQWDTLLALIAQINAKIDESDKRFERLSKQYAELAETQNRQYADLAETQKKHYVELTETQNQLANQLKHVRGDIADIDRRSKSYSERYERDFSAMRQLFLDGASALRRRVPPEPPTRRPGGSALIEDTTRWDYDGWLNG